MNAITRQTVEKLYDIEKEAVEEKHGYRFKNEQEALGTLLMEWRETENELKEVREDIENLHNELTQHKDIKPSASYLIEDVARAIQELVQVGAAAYKMLKGFEI